MTMGNIANIEFYTTPEGDVMVKEVGQPAKQLKDSDRELIGRLLTIISDRYPQAHRALMNLYSKSTMNRVYYEYKVVHRFIRCNFGEYDQYNIDVDKNGTFRMEEVRCPLRGECTFEGIICKPVLDIRLSDREMEVFSMVVDNMSKDEIASALCISPFTVDRHRDNIKAKIGVRSIAEMINYWYTNNLHK